MKKEKQKDCQKKTRKAKDYRQWFDNFGYLGH
jgi:hypothetical protein